MKKTALDNNAAIYWQDGRTRRQKWEQMDSAQKWQYFRDYYLLKLFAAVVLAALTVLVVWSIFRPKEQTVLYVAVADEVLDADRREALTKELAAYYGIAGDAHKNVVIDDSFYMDADGLTKLEVYLANGRVDVLIAQEKTFCTLAGYGFFQNLDSVAGQELTAQWQADIVRTAGYLDNGTQDMRDRETGRGAVCPYGVRLGADSAWAADAGAQTPQPVAGIFENSKNVQRAVDFLKYAHAGSKQ